MITLETIQILAKKYQTEEINVRREYFQHLFLSYFYQQEHSDKIYFKGGTALRLIYNSPRFSEDLDFDSSIKDIQKIEQAVVAALAKVEREGIKTEIEEAKETTGGYLALVRFTTNGHITPIQLEISLRKGEKRGEVTTIASDFIPPYTIIQLVQTQIIGGKIDALLSRKKPRDFYDFYFILRANLLSEKRKEIFQKVLDELNAKDIRFDQELKSFLPKSHWPVIRDFRSALRREIERFL